MSRARLRRGGGGGVPRRRRRSTDDSPLRFSDASPPADPGTESGKQRVDSVTRRARVRDSLVARAVRGWSSGLDDEGGGVPSWPRKSRGVRCQDLSGRRRDCRRPPRRMTERGAVRDRTRPTWRRWGVSGRSGCPASRSPSDQSVTGSARYFPDSVLRKLRATSLTRYSSRAMSRHENALEAEGLLCGRLPLAEFTSRRLHMPRAHKREPAPAAGHDPLVDQHRTPVWDAERGPRRVEAGRGHGE